MTAERNHQSAAENSEAAGEFEKGGFDPQTASDSEVIAYFLGHSLTFKDGQTSSSYVATALSVSDGKFADEFDEMMHARLRQIIRESDISDDSWEDSDIVAGSIFSSLRSTKFSSGEFADQRKALYRLLLLRGADVKEEAPDKDTTEQWKALVEKIGGHALKQSKVSKP